MYKGMASIEFNRALRKYNPQHASSPVSEFIPFTLWWVRQYIARTDEELSDDE
jgi:hypothetical protein